MSGHGITELFYDTATAAPRDFIGVELILVKDDKILVVFEGKYENLLKARKMAIYGEIDHFFLVFDGVVRKRWATGGNIIDSKVVNYSELPEEYRMSKLLGT